MSFPRLSSRGGNVNLAPALTFYTMSADAGSFAVTGTAASLKAARLLTVAAGAYLVTGSDIVPAVSLPASAGAYLLTGTDATLRVTRLMSAVAGAYLVTGTAATLKRSRTFSVDPGAYVVAGTDAILLQRVRSQMLLYLIGT